MAKPLSGNVSVNLDQWADGPASQGDADGNGQIEACAFFLDVSGCQVDGNFLGGKMKSGIDEVHRNGIIDPAQHVQENQAMRLE